MTIREKYNYNETMKLVGHSNYSLEELGTYRGHPEIKEILEAHVADTKSGQLITNVNMTELLYNVFLLGTIHGVRRERRRRHNAGKKM